MSARGADLFIPPSSAQSLKTIAHLVNSKPPVFAFAPIEFLIRDGCQVVCHAALIDRLGHKSAVDFSSLVPSPHFPHPAKNRFQIPAFRHMQ